MKIIFSTGWAEKQPNAITKIVIQIAEELIKSGHECIVCGVCTDYPGCEKTGNGLVIQRLPAIKPIVKSSQLLIKLTDETGNVKNARSRMIKKYPFSAVMLLLKYSRIYEEKIEQPRYEKQVQKLVADFHPDAIICTCNPVKGCRTIIHCSTTVPKYIWQMDPWGLHKLHGNSESINRELCAFNKAEYIFTTTILAELYLARPDYSVYRDKISPLEFPNIKPYISGNEKCPIDFDSGYINLLYCGTIADDIRNPEKLLKDITRIKGEKIRLYFMGEGSSKPLDEYREKYPDVIIKAGRFSARQAASAMNRADILVNISNTVDNMVPSKIFDYFSMGKPVLNLQKITNCPSRRYFDKYPLAYTIEEFNHTDTSRLLNFIKTAKGKTVPFEQVEKIYHTATVDYVAEQIEKVLTEIK